MSWSEIDALMSLRNVTFNSLVDGIPRTLIARCEQGCSISLPELYVDFLVRMGANPQKFSPFGASKICDFYTLIELLPLSASNQNRYFRVGVEGDPSDAMGYDTFIDLGRSDGQDAPVVLLDPTDVLSSENAVELGATLGELFMKRAFELFEILELLSRKTVYVFPKIGEEVLACQSKVIDLMTRKGAEMALSPLRRVVCMRTENVSILIESTGRSSTVAVRLGANRDRPIDIAIEQLRELFPSATIKNY